MELGELPDLHRRPPSPLREQARRGRGRNTGGGFLSCVACRRFLSFELDLGAEEELDHQREHLEIKELLALLRALRRKK